MIAASGLAGVSIAGVAREAGFGPATVYALFPAKNNLIAAVVEHAYAGLARRLREAVDDGDPQRLSRSAAERLDTLVRVFAETVLRKRALATALLQELAGPEVVMQRVQCRRDAVGIVERILWDGMDSGELPEQPASLVAGAIVGALIEGLVGASSPTAAELAIDPDGHYPCVEALSRFVCGASGLPTEQLVAH